MSQGAPVTPSPPFWARLSVRTGNLLQVAGLVVGAALIALAGAVRGTGLPSTILLVLGILLIYLC